MDFLSTDDYITLALPGNLPVSIMMADNMCIIIFIKPYLFCS